MKAEISNIFVLSIREVKEKKENYVFLGLIFFKENKKQVKKFSKTDKALILRTAYLN